MVNLKFNYFSVVKIHISSHGHGLIIYHSIELKSESFYENLIKFCSGLQGYSRTLRALLQYMSRDSIYYRRKHKLGRWDVLFLLFPSGCCTIKIALRQTPLLKLRCIWFVYLGELHCYVHLWQRCNSYCTELSVVNHL